MADKFLYGAAVQGIQSFIFATHDLKDIVGASELVANICGSLFDDFRGKPTDDADETRYPNGTSIVRAAGNIKFLFNDEAHCKEAVKDFPKKVIQAAPGITVSQAVVRVPDGKSVGDYIDALEARLRACRNRQPQPTTCGLMAIERSRESGLPAVKYAKGVPIDGAKKAKAKCASAANSALAQKNFGRTVACGDINSFTKKGNNWIAIIHIDGNGLGQIVQKIGKDIDKFSQFSLALDKACGASALAAANAVIGKYQLDEERLPIRPIVLSGDDHTLICRADLAIPYVQEFLAAFEEKTKTLKDVLNEAYGAECDNLTACAGIAFIKSSYPFYYGYELAEALCEQAKNDAKKCYKDKNHGMAPSCLMFHKVQDSFVSSYDDIVRRELTPAKDHSWQAGPYYLDDSIVGDERDTIDALLNNVKALDGQGDDDKEANAIKSSLRKWLTAMHDDPEMAKQLVNRMRSIRQDPSFIDLMTSAALRDKTDDGKEKQDGPSRHRAYDVLSLHSVS